MGEDDQWFDHLHLKLIKMNLEHHQNTIGFKKPQEMHMGN
jgi:hypothetical protein